MFPRILDRVVEWVKAHKQFGLEFEERGSRTWVFVRTWRRDSFYRVAVGVIDRYYGDASSELFIPGQIQCAVGNGASLVSISGGSHTLVECYKEYLGSRCMRGLLDYPTFDVRLLKRCLQKTVSTVFGTLNPFSMTFRWLNSSWPDSKALSIVIGCSQESLCDVQLRQVIFLCLGLWMLLATSSVFGRLLSLTSRRVARKTAATVLWYGFPLWVSALTWLPLLISVLMSRKGG